MKQHNTQALTLSLQTRLTPMESSSTLLPASGQVKGRQVGGKHSRCCLRLSLTFKEKQLVKFGKSAYLWVPQNSVSPKKKAGAKSIVGEVAEAYLATTSPAVFSWGGKSYGCQE